MDKNKVLDFLTKYHLGGRVEETIWDIKDKNLLVKFRDETHTVMGVGLLKDVDIENAKFGILNTSNIISAVKPLDADIRISLTSNNGNVNNVIFSDGDVNNKRAIGSSDSIEFTFDKLGLTLSDEQFLRICDRLKIDYVVNHDALNQIDMLLNYNDIQKQELQTKDVELEKQKQELSGDIDAIIKIDNEKELMYETFYDDRYIKLKKIVSYYETDENIKYDIFHVGFDVDIAISDDFVTKFNKTKKIKDAEHITIKINDNKTATFTTNYRDGINTDTGEFTTDILRGEKSISHLSFRLKLFDDILQANKKMTEKRLQISFEYDILKFTFKCENMDYKYYTVALK